MKLETVNIHKGTTIEYSSNELLFLAQSGQPYRGSLYVHFESLGKSFNTLAFKKYITSLRNKTLLCEDSAFEIYTTINESLKSKNLGVIVDISARGGLQQRLLYGISFTPVHKNNIFQVG